jgi:lipid II:glycine glycyltransferase (peptidoglycan interpeptide bridge formation enzyme)
MQVVQSLDEDIWRSYVEEHPDSSIFHSPEMYEVFSRAKGFQPTLWAVVNGDRYPLALMLPVQITMKNGVFRTLTTRATVFGSILYDHSQEGLLAVRRLLNSYVNGGTKDVLYTKLRNLKDMASAQSILSEYGFEYEEHLNYLVDLKKESAEVFRSISKSGRKAIRRSSRRGVALQEVNDRSLVPIHYDLLKQTHDRSQAPLADISLFEAIFDLLVPIGMAQMLLATSEGKYIAASLEMPYIKTIYSWYSGYDVAYKKLCPNDYLVWHILEWGADNGYDYFDFGGAGAPGEEYGPRGFKAKFGGELVSYGFNACTHSPLRLAIGRIAYDVYRKTM